MALRTTPTIAICLTAGIAAGVALARPADRAVEPANDSAAAVAEAADGDPAITIEGFNFSTSAPAAPGASVTVTNLDGAQHTLTADDGSFDTGAFSNNDDGVVIIAPTEPGAYPFFCAIHPSMVGSLIVS